jgi:choline dehydrogenase-like flavoprotein
MIPSLALIALLPLTLSAPSRPIKRDTTPIYDGSQVSGKTYDYVIAGGGLTGVVLAARLSEDSSKSVLVVESGYSEEANSVVTGQSGGPLFFLLCLPSPRGVMLMLRRFKLSESLRREHELPLLSRSSQLTSTDFPRLGLQDCPAELGEQSARYCSSRTSARRRNGHQWPGMEQAPRLSGQRFVWNRGISLRR